MIHSRRTATTSVRTVTTKERVATRWGVQAGRSATRCPKCCLATLAGSAGATSRKPSGRGPPGLSSEVRQRLPATNRALDFAERVLSFLVINWRRRRRPAQVNFQIRTRQALLTPTWPGDNLSPVLPNGSSVLCARSLHGGRLALSRRSCSHRSPVLEVSGNVLNQHFVKLTGFYDLTQRGTQRYTSC